MYITLDLRVPYILRNRMRRKEGRIVVNSVQKEKEEKLFVEEEEGEEGIKRQRGEEDYLEKRKTYKWEVFKWCIFFFFAD